MKTFYDTHMHVFDLSHPNLLSFIKRDGLLDPKTIADIVVSNVKARYGFFYTFKNIFTSYTKKKIEGVVENLLEKQLPKYINLLAIMENPVEYQFLILEHFLKHKKSLVAQNNILEIDGIKYSKIALCPLLMDFGKKNINMGNVFYDKTPKKPIAKQVEDVLNAIKIYYTHYLDGTDEIKIKKHQNVTTDSKLFDIYPYMGLNTSNYSKDDLIELFRKYFDGYENDISIESRKQKLRVNFGKFEGNIDSDNLQYFFTGIKVYPPLGFNPWPIENVNEFEKVNLLYKTAIEKRIPIVTHCSDGGFNAVGINAKELSNPYNAWSEVLKAYPKLKLCFAHFGSQKHKDNTNWRKGIVDLVNTYNNVYADISCCEGSEDYYKQLNKIIVEDKGKLKDRLLFGTDFSINLLAGTEESYNSFIYKFVNNFTYEGKHLLCADNPEKFLFDTTVYN